MKKLLIIIPILLIAAAVGISFANNYLRQRGISSSGLAPTIQTFIDKNKRGENKTNVPLLEIPDNYSLSIYADNTGGARDLELDPKANVLVSIPSDGKVLKLPQKTVVVEKLNKPHGLAFYKDKLYIAETNQVAMYDYDQNTFKASNKKKLFDLPSGGNHITRSIIFKNDKLYVSTGSSCNVCVESDSKRAAIWVANPDGSDFKLFAEGLRNSVFMTLHPQTKEIWATDMGRDLLGDDIPPEEVNIIRENKDYGWPYCWGDNHFDGDAAQDILIMGKTCESTIKPHIKMQAHSAPLGLAFLNTDLLVVFHGSWNRTEPTGYKIVKFPLDKNGNLKGEPIDFITGWLQTICAKVPAGQKVVGNGCSTEVSGRPVDILVKNENEIYISDDKANVVYLLQR